jgi:cathepsin B
VGAAGALSDRICIKSKGHVNVSVSDLDIASCAMKGRDGCKGAPSLAPAWEYMHSHGTVTGDKYHSDIGCKPYPFPPAKQAKRSFHTPTCMEQCSNILYDEKTYVEDLIKGTNLFQLLAIIFQFWIYNIRNLLRYAIKNKTKLKLQY